MSNEKDAIMEAMAEATRLTRKRRVLDRCQHAAQLCANRGQDTDGAAFLEMSLLFTALGDFISESQTARPRQRRRQGEGS